MAVYSVTLELPENIYLRLQRTAEAMRQPLDDVLLRTVQVGSPPSWEDVPAAFQADLAALDRLDDEALWRIARSSQLDTDWSRYQELLDRNANEVITETERGELEQLRTKADRFVLRKVHAAALLRWRGYQIPPAEQL